MKGLVSVSGPLLHKGGWGGILIDNLSKTTNVEEWEMIPKENPEAR